MMRISLLFALFSVVFLYADNEYKNLKPFPLNPLTYAEKRVIIDKATERPFSGKYYKFDKNGTYYCKHCNAPLYHSNAKFDSGCGWPSFDDAIPGAIKRIPDKDGKRIEIVCARCGAHLGHVFEGEGYTPKNTRYCVNSISLNFKPTQKAIKSEKAYAYFAGGCFWGVEYYLEKQTGVLDAESGYMGGTIKNPTYYRVSHGDTGYLETVRVTYDPSKVSYETLAKFFFEIHDPTQKDGQGPDIGSQYLSAIFVSNAKERKTVEKLIGILNSKGYKIATTLREASKFYKAQNYHQNHYENRGTKPYCHGYVKRF